MRPSSSRNNGGVGDMATATEGVTSERRGPSVSADSPGARSQKGDRAGRREFQARGTATK